MPIDSITKWNELVQKNRKELADMYRAARRENPKMGRLLRRRVLEAEKTMIDWWTKKLYESGS